MALRWRKCGAGDLLCAAKHDKREDDIYIDDEEHYKLSVLSKSIIPDQNEDINGIWIIADFDVFLKEIFGD